MVYGTIIQKGEQSYTFLKKVFDSIDNIQLHYKWLIAYPECYPCDEEIRTLLDREFCILTGEEWTYLVDKEDFQWIWGAFFAFDPATSDEEILKYKPFENDVYSARLKKPLSMKHPLSKIEMVALDSSCTMIFTKDFVLPE